MVRGKDRRCLSESGKVEKERCLMTQKVWGEKVVTKDLKTKSVGKEEKNGSTKKNG